MTEPGLTTPLQPVGRGRGLGPVAVGLMLMVILGVIVWRPWASAGLHPGGDPGSPRAIVAGAPVADSASLGTGASPEASADSDLFAGPTSGPWSGRVTGEWSIVAFLRSDPVSRDPLNLRQQQVAVFVGARPTGTDPGAICDAPGTFLHQAAADLPTRAVYFLGIAFPADRQVFVDGVYRLGGSPLEARPVELGRIPGDETAPVSPVSPVASAGAGPSPTVEVEPVRMFALPDGAAWPDGVYRFDVYTRDGLPTQLFACIRP
jgi:hypothetical protein